MTYSNSYGSNWAKEWWANQVLDYARSKLVFLNETEVVSKFEPGKGDGETIKIKFAKDIVSLGTTALSRGTKITQDSFVIGSKVITLAEYGKAITWDGYFDEVYQDTNTQQLVVSRLGRNWADTMDEFLKTKYDDWGEGSGTRLVVYAAGTMYCGTATAGTATDSNAALGTYHIMGARDQLIKNNIPTFSDGYYHWIAPPQALTALKEAGYLTGAAQYTTGAVRDDVYYRNEVGAFLGFRFFESNRCHTTGGGTNATSYAFGGPAIGMGVGLPMEIRFERDVGQDFDRQHAAAWYGIYGFENLWKTEPYGLFVVSNSDLRV